MKSILKYSIAAALILAMQFTASADQSGSITVSKLPNGMKVIVREGHDINLAAIDIWVRAGSLNETQKNNGISHFVEHMIFKSTAKYGPGQVDREIEGLGSELNGGTSKDWMHFYTTTASEYLPIALNAIGDAITSAQFRPEDIEKERQVIIDEIARAESDPEKQAFNLFSQVAYAIHPYSLAPAGSKEVISKITRDELVAYYKERYRPSNICVVITGDVKQESIIPMIRNAFSGFSKEPVTSPMITPDPPTEPAPMSPRAVKYKAKIKQAQVILGFRGSSASELKDLCALDVMLSILGDTNQGRVASAFNTANIRFTKIETDFVSQRYPAMFSVYAMVDTADSSKVSSIILTELRRLASEPVTDAELFHAKRLVEGGDLFQQETFAGQARALGMYDSIASWDYALKYAPMVRSLTVNDIMSAAAKYLSKDNYCLLVIEPEGSQK